MHTRRNTLTRGQLPLVQNHHAAIHRRAGIAAILRDARIEIGSDDSGTVRARRIGGACR